MRTRLETSIADVDPGEWNAIVEEGVLARRHEYLGAVEASGINCPAFFYPVVRDCDGMVAHASLCAMRTELDTFLQGGIKKAISSVRRLREDFFVMRTLECGCPVALGHTISFRKGADRAHAVRQIAGCAECLARALGIRVVVFRDFCPEEADFFDDMLLEAGYTRVQNLPNARMAVRWGRFEDYLQAMRSDYRRKVLRRQDAFRRQGGACEWVESFSAHAPDLARLWRHAFDRAREYKREVLNERFFREMDLRLGSRSGVLLMRVEGRPVGFSLLLRERPTLTWLFCGMDPRYNSAGCVYFNMIYEIVAMAIRERFEEVNFGITTLSSKLDVGATAVPLTMYMKHLGRIGNEVIPRLFGMMGPQVNATPRHVFRQ